MRIYQSLTILFFLSIAAGCGNTSSKENSEEVKTENQSAKVHKKSTHQEKTKTVESQIRKSPKKESEASENSQTEVIKARFIKFSPSTSGSIFVFEDASGEEHWFHKARNAEGMDFIDGLQPMEQPEGYENIWFNVTFENREVERAGEIKTEATIVKVEKVEASASNDQDDTGLAFSATEIKNAMFSGTEPFWSMQFREDHVLKSSPTGDVKFYYLKNGQAGDFKLEEVIQRASKKSVTLSVTDESQGPEAVITITHEPCSDGMSNTDYPYTITFVWEDGGGWNGCGKKRQ